MRDAISRALPIVEHAVAACDGVGEESLVEAVKDAVRAVRTRLSYPDEVLVVALAGGTGSGKSSLLNALVEIEVADAGGVRPTTSRALAAVPARFDSAMAGYLDALAIPERAVHDAGAVVWIDLPDTDSLEVDHRLRAEALLPVVDSIVWVFDPEKYRDARTHHDLIRPLATHHEQLVFVLNQSDRLAPDDLDMVLDDLCVALVEDGVDDPEPIALAASPPLGPAIGLDDLDARVEEMRQNRSGLYRKLITDMQNGLRDLSSEVGGAVDFDRRAREAVAESVRALSNRDRASATEAMETLYAEVSETLPAPLLETVAVLVARIPTHVQRVAETAWTPGRKKMLGRSEPPRFEPEIAERLLVESVVRPLRAHLARRAIAAASLTEAMLAIGSIGPDG